MNQPRQSSTKIDHVLAKCALLAALWTLNAQLSTFAQGSAFTWQGQLTQYGTNANGLYDLTFVLFDAGTNGAALGTNTVSAASVVNGLYTVALDFGADAFDGSARWLALSVRPNGAGSWTDLAPRLAVTPTPYSIHAATAGGVSGVIPDSQLSANIARLNTTNTFTGPVSAPSFSGSGSNLSGVAPAAGSPNYVAKSGDTMTGALNLPANGLIAGSSQLVLSGGNVGIGTTSPQAKLDVSGGVNSGGASPGNFAYSGLALDGLFTNWLGMGESPQFNRLLGDGNPYSGYGTVRGNSIQSPTCIRREDA